MELLNLSEMNKNIFICAAQKLIKISSIKQDANLFVEESSNLLGIFDLMFSITDNKKMSDTIVSYITGIKHDNTIPLDSLFHILHFELCEAAIYGFIDEPLVEFYDFDIQSLNQPYKHIGCDLNKLMYLIAKVMIFFTTIFGRDGIINLIGQAEEKVLIISNLLNYSKIYGKDKHELEDLLKIIQTDFNKLLIEN